jgi:hypothetical protein
MPQVDKATFLPIVFWTFILYVGGFLFLNNTYLYTFITAMKLSFKRTTQKFLSAVVARRFIATALLFPWIAL